MSISGRAGIAIGAASVLALGVAGTATYAAVEASSHPTSAPSQVPAQQNFKVQQFNNNRNSGVRGTPPPATGVTPGSAVTVVPAGPVSSGGPEQSQQQIVRITINNTIIITTKIFYLNRWFIITGPNTWFGTIQPPPWAWQWWNHRHPWHRRHPIGPINQHRQVTAVPSVVGEDSATATSDLQNAGFDVVMTTAVDPSGQATAGNVFRESPSSGTILRSGATVKVDVAGVAVPNVVGQDQATATFDLQNAGFRVVVKTAADPSGQATPGNVFSQRPSRGTMVTTPGVTVTIVVATQPSSPPATPPSNPTTPTAPPAQPTAPPAQPSSPAGPQPGNPGAPPTS